MNTAYPYRQRLLMLAAAFSTMTAMPLISYAQDAPPPSADATQAAPAYTPEQLDQLLAPVALYPDPLLAQILMASTYPLEIVEAQRWLQQPGNSSLKDDQLAAALEQQSWDPSVKSLVPFPQIIKMMDGNLQWTEQLGDAFLANQPAMMDSVQQLRQQAKTAGSLQSTPQQTVSAQGQDIVIQPANPQVVYVPYYNPTVVYGDWPYPDYPPFYFAPPLGFVYDGFFGFGIGIAIIAPFWGWDHWDWGHHRIDIDDGRFRRINHDRAPIASGVWRHDPSHRGGVPYHSAAVRSQFQHASEETRRSYRGYGSAAHAAIATPMTPRAESAHETSSRAVRPNPEIPARERTAVSESRVEQPHVSAPTPQRPAPPAFESFSRGADVKAQAARGSKSRTAAAPAAKHADGGKRDGDEKHR